LKQIQNVATNLIHGSLAKSSKESYRRVFAFNKEFMLLYFPLEIVFPASLEHLTLFIAYCFQKKIASSTVLTYMSAISFLLQLGGYEDLTGHFIISKALRGYHKEKAAKDSRLPITPSILKGLCQSLPKTCSSRFLQLMLHAMYLLAFHAFLRIGEITGLPPPLGNCLSVNDIKFLQGDSEGLEIQMSKFKHSTGKHIPVLFLSSNNSNKAVCPVHSLWSYLQLRGKESSNVQPLFSFMDNAPITRSFFNSQLQLSLKFAGLNVKNYKSHSFRIGAATTAWAKGFSEEQIQQMGRWNSEAFKKYIRIPLLSLQ
jgi:integrase